MSIVAAELVWRAPAEVSDDDTNGGRMTATELPSGVKNNIFPDVPQAERTAGSTKWRKIFIHVANDADLTLLAAKVFVESQTVGDDNVVFREGGQFDVQNAMAGASGYYGEGKLNSNVSAAATQMSVLTEDAALDMFRLDMLVRISDKAYINGAGNEEFVTVTSATPSYNGNICTFSFTPALANGYSATNTKVSGVYEAGDIAAAFSSWVRTSTSGTYDQNGHPPILDHIATPYQEWTVTFTSATEYTVTGDELGEVGDGNTGSDFSPNNPDFSKPYFTLESAGFGGTWQTGDTITFITLPAAIPVWYRRKVPAGAASLSGNSFIVAVSGESE